MKFRESSLEENIADINSTAQYCTDPKYTYWHAITTPWRGRRVVRILKDYFHNNDKILDLGCSQGLTIGYISQVFSDVVGVDIDKEALATARKRFKRLNIKSKVFWYNGKKLPFKSNTFNGAISSEVFEHVDNPKLFVEEISRVLKPNGKLIISTPNKLYPMECEFHLPFLSYLPKKYADLYVRLSGKGKSYDHINHPTYSRFTKTLAHSFNTEDITLHIIKNAKKYYLDQERGFSAKLFSKLLKLLDKTKNTPFEIAEKIIKNILIQLVPGWILVGTKKI